tara:strand:- start:2180 stop:2803 length:624 start_codon:yes stop_codon:yes gene_type:complete
LCHKLKRAAGKATTFEKCITESAIANPEFCIPTSIEIVFIEAFDRVKNLATKYPINRPPILWRITPIRIVVLRIFKLSELIANITAITNAIVSSEIIGNKNFILSTNLKKYILTNNPKIKGINIILDVEYIRLIRSIFILLSARNKIRYGVNKIDRIVEVRVHIKESGTLPLIKYVITFEAVPPGHDPKIINPRLISLDRFKTFTIK